MQDAHWLHDESPSLAQELSQRCTKQRRHGVLFGWKAKHAEAYPAKVCSAILTGIVNQLRPDGNIDSHNCLFAVCEEPVSRVEYPADITNKPLDPDRVAKARREELAQFETHGVYVKVPIEDGHAATGEGPIGSGWFGINKGVTGLPEYRSRLVAKEVRRNKRR